MSAGELVAIVGPSGAGKTTLLETVAGTAPATPGSVRFDGVDVYGNLSTFRSVLGYEPQDDIIHADLRLECTSATRRVCGSHRRQPRQRSMARCATHATPSA